MTRRSRAVIALTVVVAACSGGDGSGGGAGDPFLSTVSAVTIGAGDDSLAIMTSVGCSEFDHLDVHETDAEVMVGVTLRPTPGQKFCDLMPRDRTDHVALAAPVGDRAIIVQEPDGFGDPLPPGMDPSSGPATCVRHAGGTWCESFIAEYDGARHPMTYPQLRAADAIPISNHDGHTSFTATLTNGAAYDVTVPGTFHEIVQIEHRMVVDQIEDPVLRRYGWLTVTNVVEDRPGDPTDVHVRTDGSSVAYWPDANGYGELGLLAADGWTIQVALNPQRTEPRDAFVDRLEVVSNGVGKPPRVSSPDPAFREISDVLWIFDAGPALRFWLGSDCADYPPPTPPDPNQRCLPVAGVVSDGRGYEQANGGDLGWLDLQPPCGRCGYLVGESVPVRDEAVITPHTS